jgi:hypothetical protein
VLRATSTFVRPADTTQYAAGDLVANSTTAGSVTPLSFVSPKGTPSYIKSVSLYHTDQDATGSTFRVWFLSSSPTVTNGDNGALAGIDAATVLGTVAITADQNCGDTYGITAAPAGLAVSGTVYAVIEATGTYTPASAETFGVSVVFDRQ